MAHETALRGESNSTKPAMRCAWRDANQPREPRQSHKRCCRHICSLLALHCRSTLMCSVEIFIIYIHANKTNVTAERDGNRLSRSWNGRGHDRSRIATRRQWSTLYRDRVRAFEDKWLPVRSHNAFVAPNCDGLYAQPSHTQS